MDVSIVIINYRSDQLIIDCLATIYNYTRDVRFEVIVVDNDPERGGKAQVLGQYPEVRWIDMAYNSGFGRANNAGMKVARGRYFLLLNADTLLIDDVIGRCVQRMDTRPDIVACGALQHYADYSPMPFYQSFNDFRRTFFILPPGGALEKLVAKWYPEPNYDDPDQYDWLVGAFVFVRREGYERTGGFGEDFFMYGEDVEWSGRLGELGKLCIFEDCRYVHLENKNPFRRTNISWINRFSTQMQVSNLLWIRKQYGVLAYLTLILHYAVMIPVVFGWRMALNARETGNPFSRMSTQRIFLRKTGVLFKYFWRTLFLKKGLYRIKPTENIDLLTAAEL